MMQITNFTFIMSTEMYLNSVESMKALICSLCSLLRYVGHIFCDRKWKKSSDFKKYVLFTSFNKWVFIKCFISMLGTLIHLNRCSVCDLKISDTGCMYWLLNS